MFMGVQKEKNKFIQYNIKFFRFPNKRIRKTGMQLLDKSCMCMFVTDKRS